MKPALDPTLQAFQKSLSFFLDVNYAMLDGHRRLRSLQSAAAGKVEEAVNTAQEAIKGAEDWTSLFALQADLLRREVGQSVEYWHSLFQVAQSSQAAYQQILQNALGEWNGWAGGDNKLVANALQQFVDASTLAFDAFSKTAQRASEIAQAGIAKSAPAGRNGKAA